MIEKSARGVPDPTGPSFRVRVRGAGEYGSGTLVTDRHVLTCDHVVAGGGAARVFTSAARPGGEPTRVVEVRVVARGGDGPGGGAGELDLALLEFAEGQGPIEGASPARISHATGDDWRMLRDRRAPELVAHGFAHGEAWVSRSPWQADGPFREDDSSERERTVQEFRIGAFGAPGYSGGPITVRLAGVEHVVGVARLGGDDALVVVAIGSGPVLGFLGRVLPEHFGAAPESTIREPLSRYFRLDSRESYLLSLRRRLERLPSAKTFASELPDSSLKRVFVPLQVARAEHPGQGEPGRSPQTLEELAQTEHERGKPAHWLVLGVPGSGKTTLSHELCARLAGEAEPRWVPLHARLTDLQREAPRGSLWNALVDSAASTGRGGQFRRLLEEARAQGQVLAVLDGYDELGAHTKGMAARIEGLAQELEACPLIVTARTISHHPDSFPHGTAYVQPLSEESQTELLERCFAQERPQGLEPREWRELLHGAGMARDCGNPLYLTLAAFVIRRTGELPRNRRDLFFARVVEEMLKGAYKGGGEAAEEYEVPCGPEVLSILSLLSMHWVRNDLKSERESSLGSWLRVRDSEQNELWRTIREEGPWEGRSDRFWRILHGRSALIGPYEKDPDRWSFWHGWLGEYLARLQVAAMPRPDLIRRAQDIEGPSLESWAEPLSLACAQIHDPDDLVLAIARDAGNVELALRAAANAARLAPSTIQELLELKDLEGEEERGQILLSVPEKLSTETDDGRAAVIALLIQLGRSRRSAADLYFVHEAIAKLSESGLSADGVEEALRRLYREATPDARKADLFGATIVDAAGREAPLWVEMALEEHGEGERWDDFLMGSPECERGEDRERPRHPVRLTRPFHAFATPVTNAQFAVLDGDHESRWKGKIEEKVVARCPVTDVSWYAAMAFARWVGFWQFGSLEGSLPTEAQWEYLCRKRADGRIELGRFACGEDADGTQLANFAWFSGNPKTEDRVHPVASLEPTGAGFYDLHGNVWEWCLGAWRTYPSEASQQPETDPEDAAGPDRAVRGGAFWGVAGGCRSAYRVRRHPAGRVRVLGFRPVVPSPRLGIDR